MGTSVSPAIYVLPDAVVARMQINSELEGVTGVVISALEGSQLHVETVLESRLSIQAWDAKYYLDRQAFSSMQPGGVYTLEIPSCFVRKDAPFTIQVASNWMMTDAVPIPATDYALNYEKGIVSVVAGVTQSMYNNLYPNSTYDNKFVSIQCTTGFKSGDPNDLDNNPPEVIPDWLQEAILAYVGVIFDTSQTTNRDAQASAIYGRSGSHAMAVLQPYLRKRGFIFRPVSLG